MRSNMMPLGSGSTHGLLRMGGDSGESSHGQQQSGDEQKLCAVCNDQAICQVTPV